MKIHLNYAKGRYLASQKACSKSAVEVGGFDDSKPYSEEHLDSEFRQRNQYTLMQSRGAGFWLWKPYLLLDIVSQLDSEDYLMYTDSGMMFLRDPWGMISLHEDHMNDKGIAFFTGDGVLENKYYTKRDTFILMQADDVMYTDGRHLDASVVLCKKTPFSIAFLEEWLAYAQDPRILTDLPNTQGKPNYPEFRDHRHDQSIASILAIRHGLTPIDRITQWHMPNPYILHHRNPA